MGAAVGQGDGEGAGVAKEVEPALGAVGFLDGLSNDLGEGAAVFALVGEESDVDSFPGLAAVFEAVFEGDGVFAGFQGTGSVVDNGGDGEFVAFADVAAVGDFDNHHVGVVGDEVAVDAVFEGVGGVAGEGCAEHRSDAVEPESGEAVGFGVDETEEIGGVGVA